MASRLRFRSVLPAGAALLAIGLLATPAVAANRGGMIQVIVNFRGPHVLLPAQATQNTQTIKEAGGKVTHSFRLINSQAATIPASELNALEAQPNVKSVELDATIHAFSDPELDAAWGVKHIGAGDVHDAGNTGQGVKVGIIDTGIDYTHPELAAAYAGGYDFFNNDADPFDDNGHGTHVAGIIAAQMNGQGVVGVAPGARLYSYKVLGADGSGDYSGMIAALERASLVDHVQVINMSLGGSTPSQALADEVAAVYARGTIMVAASGNVDPTNFYQLLYGCPVAYPAAYPQVFSTTFTNPNDALTGFSCTGPEVDFASPGDSIYSSVPTGSCMFCSSTGYNTLSGTSMASPHLAGVVALVLAHGIKNQGDMSTLADDVKAHLCANTSPGFGVNSTPIPPTDSRYPQYFGCGVVNATKALITNPPPTDGPPVNQPPVATDDSVTTLHDTLVTIDVLANDTDVDGDTLSVTAVTSPAHGTAVINNGKVNYTPASSYSGPDSFDYTVSDGNGGTDTGTVNLTVLASPNNPPVATDDSASTLRDTPVTVDVLANDTDVDGDTLSITSVTSPAHGTAAINNGKVSYTPTSGYTGADTFDYTVSDGNGGTDTGTVNVTVTAPPNHPPVATDDFAITQRNTLVTVNVLANDTDADGDTLSVTGVTSPAHGTAVVNNGKVDYTPASSYTGPDSFDYTVSDGNGGTDTGTVNVTVNAPPVAADDTATTVENTAVTVDVLANDTDPEGNSLVLSGVTKPAHGTTKIVSGQVKYTPTTYYTGSDSFDYTVSDGMGGTDTGTVNVTVNIPSGPIMHIGDLDDVSTAQKNTWTGKIRIVVLNRNDLLLSGVTVTGVLSNGITTACTTGSNGQCTINLPNLPNTLLSMGFTVTKLARSGTVYVPALNGDPESDSNGTTITIYKP